MIVLRIYWSECFDLWCYWVLAYQAPWLCVYTLDKRYIEYNDHIAQLCEVPRYTITDLPPEEP